MIRDPSRNFLPAAAALAFSIPIAGCASPGDYPSLAIRDAERVSATVEPVSPNATPAPLPPPAPELADRLSQLVAQARDAHNRFGQMRGRAESALGRAGGSGPGSDGWAAATMALADLTTARGATMSALTELDLLATADALKGGGAPTGDTVTIAAARDEVAVWVAAEDGVLATLGSRLRN
ncbi:MAG: hypothetical protein M0R03_10285 [Novosphingobium sp.]|nr:hypothetical protein [Novosphingobium sp.]